MEENKKALDEIYKGCCMGIEAINTLISKIDSKEFRDELDWQMREYKRIEDDINNIYGEYSKDEPKEIGGLTKTMSESMMNIKTMVDQTDSKIAEMLFQGTNMGIVEGRKILNNKKIDEEVTSLVEEFITFQESAIENIKKYL